MDYATLLFSFHFISFNLHSVIYVYVISAASVCFSVVPAIGPSAWN